jgi:pyruvate/2-oxoglutarate dehydrogenase complex dihydrolipoamide acyltransferase (E2) component
MSVNVKMPKWDVNMLEGRITQWFQKEGDMLHKNDDLFEVESGGQSKIVKSPVDGKISQIMIPAGRSVPVKVVVAILKKPGEH